MDLATNTNTTLVQARMNKELHELRNTMKLGDIYLINRNYQVLAQAESSTTRHDLRLYIDQQEIDSAFQGTTAEGFLYNVATTYYKRGYTPLRDTTGNIIAVLGVEASAQFFQTTNKIRKSLLVMGLISIMLIIVTIIVINRIFAAMLRLEERVLAGDKLKSLAQLSAGVAHEIRNPLGIISGNAELLKEAVGEDKDRKELVDHIISETERLEKILRNYLEFSKPATLENSYQNINEILEKTLQLCQHQLHNEGIVVNKQFQEDLPPVRLDAQRMIQVFLNLILNAKEALLQGGWLTIRSVSEDRSILIEIIDSGMGINPENMNKIFEPFYTTKKTGSGLGLSIAKRIVEEHHGTIEIKSEPGKGTTARVILPSG